MNEIRRPRFDSIRRRKIFKEKTGSESAKSGDAQRLHFKRTDYEDYTFEEGKILLNGYDVEELINKGGVEIRLWDSLISAVDDYRKHVWLQYGTDSRDFNGKAQALLEKLLNKLTHSYDTMSGGLRVQFQGGRLWINDIDPKVVLSLFLSNPTEERRRYLESIKTKLALILAGKVGKSCSHGVLEEASRIYQQIHQSLENSPSASRVPLLAGVGDLDR